MIWMRLALKAWVCWEMALFWNLGADRVRSDVRGIVGDVWFDMLIELIAM